jgi:GMP synthase-like glutamine amidotransferase
MASPVVACLHHLDTAFTGHAGRAIRAAGVELDERHVIEGDPLPGLGEVDGILTLGGDQSVRDIASIPVLEAEAALLRDAVEAGVPVLGVCLGAQLLAHATGGRVDRLPQRMVTWAPIEPLDAASGDPVMGALPAGAMALHWNEDGFEPPPGAVELLRRPDDGGAQGFRVGSAWGIQFHPEVDSPTLDGWYAGFPYAVDQAGVAMADARAADTRHMPGQAALAEAIFGGFARYAADRAAVGDARA